MAWTQIVVYGPGPLVSPGSLLEIHSFGSHLRPTAFEQDPGVIWVKVQVEKHSFKIRHYQDFPFTNSALVP